MSNSMQLYSLLATVTCASMTTGSTVTAPPRGEAATLARFTLTFRLKASVQPSFCGGASGGSHGPNGDMADSPDEAKAAFRAAWEAGG